MNQHPPLSPIRRATRAALLGSVLASCLAVGTPANAALSFVFDYGANNGKTEFLDPTFGLARQTALETAGTLFSNYFGSLFTNSAAIHLAVEGTDTPLPGTLAYAGSFQAFDPPFSGGFGNSSVVYNKMMGNGDLNGTANDGVVGVNWGAPWELDPNVPVSGTPVYDFDLFAALFHEFTHALGFASSINEAGNDGTSQNGGAQVGGVDYFGFWAKFDEFKTDCGTTNLIDHGTGLTNQPTYDDAKISSMCFNGANAVAANGGAQVALYAPNPYEPGSSGSHLDESGNNIGAMMKYDRDGDIDEARTYNAIEIGVLMDLGYTRVSTTVPEPTTALLVLGALGALGLSRRKKKA